MRSALIHNPNSRRNQQDGEKFVNFARQKMGDLCIYSRHDEHLSQHIQELKNKNVDVIAINGGDGTVSGCLTTIAALYPQESLPFIAVLPSGNTNLIASDVGFGLRGKKAIEELIARDHFRWSERAPIQLSWLDDEKDDVIGMFGGCSGYARAIRIAHQPSVNKFAPHDLAVFYTVFTSVLSLIFPKKRHLWMNGDYFKSNIPLLTRREPKTECDKSFLFIATALEKLNHGIWPFWTMDDKESGFHFLNVAPNPKNLLSTLCHLLRGRSPTWLREHEDYQSGRLHELILESESDFVLDGEVFSSSPTSRLCLKQGPSFRFIHV